MKYAVVSMFLLLGAIQICFSQESNLKEDHSALVPEAKTVNRFWLTFPLLRFSQKKWQPRQELRCRVS
jgi:hypothetical protein